MLKARKILLCRCWRDELRHLCQPCPVFGHFRDLCCGEELDAVLRRVIPHHRSDCSGTVISQAKGLGTEFCHLQRQYFSFALTLYFLEYNGLMRWLKAYLSVESFAVLIAIFLAALLAASVVAQTNGGVLAVRGSVEQPLTLSLSDLQAMQRAKLKAREKDGGKATFEGVALFDVVGRAKPKLSEHCCSNAINTMVVINAADNYQAAFSLPELDPKFGHRQILLADRRNGQPLGPLQGPLQIIVPEDKVYARWVRQVNLIEILSIGDLRQASTKSLSP
jgi:hypothetical protein